MADKDPETIEPEKTEKSSDDFSITDLKSMVREIVDEAIGSRSSAPKTQTHNQKAASIAEEVDRALEKVAKDKEEKEAKEASEGRLKALEEKITEKPPVQRRKIHNVMGWGD